MLTGGAGQRSTVAIHLGGPAWAGSRRGWIEPAEAARALVNVVEDSVSAPRPTADAWRHVSREAVNHRSAGDDYDGYVAALADAAVAEEEPEDREARRRGRDLEGAIEASLGVTVIDETGRVAWDAAIGRGVRIARDAVVEAGAEVGLETYRSGADRGDLSAPNRTRIGYQTQIAAGAVVARGATVGDDALVGEGATVRSVGDRSVVGDDALCRGDVRGLQGRCAPRSWTSDTGRRSGTTARSERPPGTTWRSGRASP